MVEHTVKLNITASAAAHIKQIMARRKVALGFRLSMKKYGCNGYGYVAEVVEQVHPGDLQLSIADFPVYVDPTYKKYLENTTIDFVEKGLGQKQMIFRNPNTEGECGCGESVNFKEKQE